jgi:thiamine-monophosphate kinase
MSEAITGLRLNDVGEYAVHSWLSEVLASTSPTTLVGVGDDCAVLDIGIPEKYLLVTTDRIPLTTDKVETGRFAVVHNISDVLAMRGVPIAFLLNIYLPRDTPVKDFEDIVIGARETCQNYAVQIVGGDTKEDQKTTIVGTCLGLVSHSDLLLRSGAKPGDIIAITRCRGKELGVRWAYWITNYFGICPELRSELHQVYLEQLQIPFEIMMRLRGVPGPTSCLDMTEGLLGASLLISNSSCVKMVLEHDKLERLVSRRVAHVASKFNKEPISMLFNPGFDWENMMTIDAKHAGHLFDTFSDEIIPIGRVEPGKGIYIRFPGQEQKPLAVFSDEKFMSYAWQNKAEAWKTMVFY